MIWLLYSVQDAPLCFNEKNMCITMTKIKFLISFKITFWSKSKPCYFLQHFLASLCQMKNREKNPTALAYN